MTDTTAAPSPTPTMLRGFVTRDGSSVVLLPETFAGHPGLKDESQMPTDASRLSSPTVEPIAHWREVLVTSPKLMDFVFAQVQTSVHQSNGEVLSSPQTLAQAKIAVATMDTLRQQLDHLLAMLPADSSTWNSLHRELSEKARDLYDHYTSFAAALYGNAFPLDGPTGVPVLPEEMRGVTALAGFPPLEGVNAHEGDGMSVAILGQISANYARTIDYINTKIGRDGQSASLPSYCCENGVFPLFGDGDMTYAQESPLPGLTILPPLALSTTGLIYAALASPEIRKLAQETQNLVRWADRAGQCIAAGNEPSACTGGG